jgi:hypothetical protein
MPRPPKRELYEAVMESFERALLDAVLADAKGNKAEAARRLGVSYATMKNRLGRVKLRDRDAESEEGELLGRASELSLAALLKARNVEELLVRVSRRLALQLAVQTRARLVKRLARRIHP